MSENDPTRLMREAADRPPKETEAQRMSMEEDEDAGRNHLVAYRLLADSAERAQDRRQLANSFFISVNLAIGAAYTFLLHASPVKAAAAAAAVTTAAQRAIETRNVMLLSVAGIGVVACLLWFATLWYYRALLSAKFRLLGEFEVEKGLVGFQREWEVFSARHPFGLRWVSLAYIEMTVAVLAGAAHIGAALFLVTLPADA